MDADLINRFKMATLEKMLDICCEIIDQGNFGRLWLDIGTEFIRNKLHLHNIDENFNFYLWRKLNQCATYFNYLKLSKKVELKLKWMEMIVREIPDIDLLFEETHAVFDKYKDILMTYFSIVKI